MRQPLAISHVTQKDVIEGKSETAKLGIGFIRIMQGPERRIAMKPRLLASAIVLAAMVAPGAAFAASGRSAAEPATAPSAMEKFTFSPADREAFLDARIAAIRTGLKLTPEQEKLWPVVEAAIRKAGKDAIERMQKFKEEKATESFIERLRERGENAVAHGQDLQAIAKAAEPLYAALNEDQRHRLPVLIRMIRPHFFHHHFAMMGGQHERSGWQGGD
jgi:zinc resistance-associated protein